VSRVAVRRALISVHDKRGLADLARGLHEAGVEIVSTGSTAAAISAAGPPVQAVEDLTGFPECLDGRVKTLHPRVHAGLLADVTSPAHREQLAALAIEPFQLLVSNLYPFGQAVASGADPAECVEQIDIGGPAMVRAAAKNHASVAVVTDPERYAEALDAVRAGGFTLDQRRSLAAAAFAHTAAYDAAIATWFASGYAADEEARQTGWPAVRAEVWYRRQALRYGENPHQRAALYVTSDAAGGIAEAVRLHGKEMSYNNYVDTDAGWRAACGFAPPCVAIMKHANPCGIALGADLAEAHRKANACDPVSAFGGIIAANGVVTAAMARQVAEVFTEVIVAPGYEQAALEILTARRNLRVLQCPASASPSAGTAGEPGGPGVQQRTVGGGLLLQTADRADQPGDEPGGWQLAAGPPASPDQLRDLAFAWRACRSVKSNAILLASGEASVGIGMGQVNRVDAVRLAIRRAGERAAGSVAASDAFFPFGDSIEVLADGGIAAVAEPGGSVRDAEVIEAAGKAGISLYLTGVRHFLH
jgi:phosphoribosylaminoimidazolecarboxamide formyltransferase/IMP cyclohydrolase